MFGSNQPTEFDLRFSLMGIPIRVHPFFWLLTAVLGWDSMRLGPPFLILWVVICFVSILVHELGHALVSRWLGCGGQSIELYGMGGLARFLPTRRLTRTHEIAIALAGPMAGFILWGLMRFVLGAPLLRWGTVHAIQNGNPQLSMLIEFGVLYWLHVNLWWGLLNLLPIFPLDGGQVSMAICRSMNPLRGDLTAHKIGMVVAGIAAIYFFQQKQTYSALLFASLAMNNYQMLERSRY
ncbi:MAG: hypothetical protein DWH91_01835 [Planctomycetota bacterium]|nr:MAG: hypothetical protein DWH91_01835 [Planctomycetota bacterium]